MEKSKIIEKLFYYIVTFSYLILPISFFFIGTKKKEVIPIILYAYGIVCFAFLFLYKFYYADIPKLARPYYQTFYTFFEYVVFTSIFWIILKQKKFRNVILVCSTLFFVFQVLYVTGGRIKKLDSMPIGVEFILILIYIIYFFYTFSRRLDSVSIYNHFAFWFSVGILIYLGGSFFFFILIEHLNENQINTFGNFTFVAEIIKNILFVLALFIYVRNPFETKKKSESIPFLDMI